MVSLHVGQRVDLGFSHSFTITRIEKLEMFFYAEAGFPLGHFAMSKSYILATYRLSEELRQAIKQSLIEGIQMIIAQEVQIGTLQYIYQLNDPRDGTTHYIGVTKNLKRRFREHLAGRDANKKKYAWIQELQQLGLQPTLVTLEIVRSRMYAHIQEDYWIHYYAKQHVPLFNIPNFFGATVAAIRGETLTIPPDTVLFSREHNS